ncbi:flagellar basal-body rod protein FlgG [Halarcobacter ebronensis]|uniref:Flagellar basal-body rod protein FlgG n=1 Tax=Halarcobacter ebronensis TaxID=1462615 RepID=A0A4Q1AYV6_9BACT|nr:flagellar basal-body rod protein FlgG [Halarcobacter ebronensis]QKF82915.1 flagellar distal rod protein FlgF [Halarcobacter ebronensis]RXK06931.1 flagellar basal body rod protein FlgG [Halarcobacter ebronensis]
MIRGLYTAATGMNAMQNQIDVTSNNIANVNTIGFKQDRAEFQDLMYESLNYTSGLTSETTMNPTGIDVGLGVKTSGVQKNFKEGDLQTTNNTLDLAIQGNGFFQITMPNGDIAYTRGGAFKLDNEGNLVNGSGYLLEPQITIPENLIKVSIANDGTVSAEDPQTGEITELGQITLVDFINPAGLTPLGNSLYLSSDASGDPIEGVATEEQFGSISQGMIELSNVKLVNEMVDLITAQRAYEANSKSISTADDMLAIVNQLKN